MNDDNSNDEVKAADRSHSHWLGWTLGLLTAVVVYFLTLPPVILVTIALGGSPHSSGPPAWLVMYGAPYFWMMEHTPFREPLTAYGDWWSRMFGLNV